MKDIYKIQMEVAREPMEANKAYLKEKDYRYL